MDSLEVKFSSEPPLPAAAVNPPLGRAVSHGLLWMMFQTLGVKIVGVIGQVMLAWLLKPVDMGLVGIAFSIDQLVGNIKTGGVREVLIQRQKRYATWANAAFWFSLAAGLATGAVMIVLASIVAKAYHEPTVRNLIFITAATCPLGISMVATARLQIQLRFRSLATINVIGSVINTGTALCLAACGMGPYSIVAGSSVSIFAITFMVWFATRPPIRLDPQLRKWKYLAGNGGRVVGARLADGVINNCDFVLLGLLRGEEVLGIYYFAFNLSAQTLSVLGANLEAVLFPTLSRLSDEPERQASGFIRASCLLALVAVPVCFLQAALADPLIRLVFPIRWQPSILPLQLLSIGMAFRTIGYPARSLMQSQGRFRALMWFNLARMFTFILFVLAGTAAGTNVSAAVTVAGFVSFYFILESPIAIWMALKPARGPLVEILKIFLGPVVIGTGSFAATIYLTRLAASPGQRPLVEAIVITGLSSLLYIVASAILVPSLAGDLAQRVRSLIFRSEPR